MLDYLEAADPGEVGWVDFPDFVAEHSWGDAASVHQFAVHVRTLWRARHELERRPR